ncbi:IS4 family transposase [Deinococcus sp.]|uniref:IS4 family transposase n=1 Tax=Deinococcus sp. TaxID=47478 RepID=UPI003B5C7C9C
MKTQSRHPHDSLQTALRSAFHLDARRLEVFCALILAMIQARSVVLYTLKTHVNLLGSVETRYQRLLRFAQFVFPDGLLARFALSVLPSDELWLILDRTNWKLGKKDINILLLSAVWNGFSLPLMWTLLPHGGNSNQRHRQELIERFLNICKNRPVSGLLADREFIGKDWFTFLDRHKIVPCIRLRADSRVGGVPVWACLRKLQIGEVRVWHQAVSIYGVKLRVCATKNAAGEMLYLAYRGYAKKNLVRYAQRWQAENLHSALKTRGFNLEDTGLTKMERVSTLLNVVSVAFIWSCLTGEFQAAAQPRKRKNHGYHAISIFRLGLDHLQDLLLHPSRASWTALASLMLCFEG